MVKMQVEKQLAQNVMIANWISIKIAWKPSSLHQFQAPAQNVMIAFITCPFCYLSCPIGYDEMASLAQKVILLAQSVMIVRSKATLLHYFFLLNYKVVL